MPTRTIAPTRVSADSRTDGFFYDAPCTNNPAHGTTRFSRPREVAVALFERDQMIFSCCSCGQLRMPNEGEARQLRRLLGPTPDGLSSPAENNIVTTGERRQLVG